MARHIFIGDIQGCRAELETLLEKVRYDPAGDELHPVGDFVNRGPDSAGVLRLLQQLGAGGVLGNHDLHAIAALQGHGRRDNRDTLKQLLRDPDAEELIHWLAERPFVRAWPEWICVHAGLCPTWDDPVEALQDLDPWDPCEDAHFVTRVRFCSPKGKMAPKKMWRAKPPFAPWDQYWRERTHETRTVVFGHWAMRGLVEEKRTRGLDTGCVWGGELTAWIAEDDRFVSTPARRMYASFH